MARLSSRSSTPLHSIPRPSRNASMARALAGTVSAELAQPRVGQRKERKLSVPASRLALTNTQPNSDCKSDGCSTQGPVKSVRQASTARGKYRT